MAVTTPTTWNPSDKGGPVVLSGGNLVAATNSLGSVRSVFSASGGKWYWEVTVNSAQALIGIAKAAASLSTYPGGDANGWSTYLFNGTKYNNNIGTAFTSAAPAGSVVGVKLDLDNGTLGFIINGVDLGNAFTGLTGTFFAMVGGGSSGTTATFTANFGATTMAHSVPAGYETGFGTQVFVATALGPTSRFGTPIAGFDQVADAAALGPVAQFGIPYTVFDQVTLATGVTTTAFGTPLAGFDKTAVATGFVSGGFGIPSYGLTAVASSLRPTVRFGTPFTPTDRVCVARGFLATKFPAYSLIPIRIGAPSNTRMARARALYPGSRFGTPAAL